MRRIRVRPPKICHFDIWIILSWGRLRNSGCRESSVLSPFLSKRKTSISICKCAPIPGRGEKPLTWSYISKPYWEHLYLPLVSPLLPTIYPLLEAEDPFPLSRHMATICPFVKMVYELWGLIISLGFHFFSVKPHMLCNRILPSNKICMPFLLCFCLLSV